MWCGLSNMRVYPAKLVDGWVEKRFEPVVSEEIIKEYREVLPEIDFQLWEV